VLCSAAGWVKKKERGREREGRERMMFLEAQRPYVLGLVRAVAGQFSTS